ncbi:extracellular solute-binding protein [Paenibacillus sp. GYB004]|uniref:ABC transporter substrate-binding protein n=1 Tax=Paenibacillus sp. GYB004 TaxID=2994393 RepID=UPI002F96E004
MKRGTGKTVAVSLLTALLVSACGGNADKGAGNPEPVNDKGAAEVKETSYPPAKLVIYSTSGWTEEVFNERFGNAIKAKFPQHTFEYIQWKNGTRYPDLIASKQEIDIVWESIAKFASGPLAFNMQMDMTELMKTHKVDTSRIEPTLMDLMREMSGGKMYALPVQNNTTVLYYNKDIFDKFGVSYPKNGMTWDEVFELNKRLTRTDGNVQYVGLAMQHYFPTNSLSLGYVDLKTEKPTISSEKWRSLYEVYGKLAEPQGYKDKIRAGKKIPEVISFVKDKDVAMLAALANTHMTQDMSSMNWDVVSMPVFKEAPQTGPQGYPTYFGVSAISKNKDQSMEVIKYLISDEFQLSVSKTGALPVVNTKEIKDAFAKDTNFSSKNVKVAFYEKFAPIAPKTMYDPGVESAYNKNIISYALGEMDLNTLLRQAEEAATKSIADQKK